jgi:hypothetical protein
MVASGVYLIALLVLHLLTPRYQSTALGSAH